MSDDESDSEGEDSEPHWDEILPPQAPTFEVDRDIDMTSQALRDMSILLDHQSIRRALPLMSVRPLERQVRSQIGIGRLRRTFSLFFTVF